ncbi:hypothetical protein [Luteimonas saliphila]|uniref:hypothetical protein n=1 Tax=Luteimonas saliphila TaxID=2804919 RepID=UPI00192D8F4A|nr:hypothetical protein [Luteimonas saliphila]
MRERPIPFTAPMVRAILAGRKTQTRRLVRPQPHPDRPPRIAVGVRGWDGNQFTTVRSPYGLAGDRLWVKETWRPRAADSPWDLVVRYAADKQDRWFYDEEFGDKDWNMPKAAARGNVSPRFMPRWASRITLEVTGVRVERLQDISEADVQAEGCMGSPLGPGADALLFPTLWDQINGAGAWNANPWVWVVEFKRVTA